jgi:AcrR family transcriptional regulator
MMPRSPEQFEKIREESRERIVGSALRLFGEHGFGHTSVRMIAEEAGVSQGLLYNYFEGKDALLRSIFERSMAQVEASFERAMTGTTPAERIERLIRTAFDLVRENLPFWRLTYQIRMQHGVLEGLGGSVAAWSGAIRLQLEEFLGAAGVASPPLEARVLFAAIDGAAQHYAMDPEQYPLTEVADALVERFRPIPGTRSPRPARERKR